MEFVSVEAKEIFFMVAFTEDDFVNLRDALDNTTLNVDLKTPKGKKQEKALQGLWELVIKTLKDYRGEENGSGSDSP